MELLSPAGSFLSLQAAVQNGADAVYIGASEFSARQFADNFDDISAAVSYAHLRHVKVYLAINTLIHDREIPRFLELAKTAAKSGIDAFIVQDLGCAMLLKKLCPAVALHASTQMTIHNTAQAQLLQSLGFQRIVLARELSFEQICTIAKNVQLELEIFVHGALCVCYSGQCLMSSLLGARSANSGACAQPCRLPYTLDGKEGYWLSPKDLCLIDRISDMKSIPVSSLKIEGRMKRPEYVATVTAIYKKALKQETITQKDHEDLLLAFNRGGFTQGLFSSEQDRIDFTKPDNNGLYLGKVVRVFAEYIVLDTQQELGDSDEIAPNLPDANKYKIKKAVRLKGSEIKLFLSCTSAFTVGLGVNLISRAYSGFDASVQKIKNHLTGNCIIVQNDFCTFTVSDSSGLCASVKSCEPSQTAKTRALTADDVIKQLCKTGNTPYTFDKLHVSLSPDTMLAASVLNAMRRDALLQYEQQKLAVSVDFKDYLPQLFLPQTIQPKLSAQVMTQEQALAVIDDVSILYIPIQSDWQEVHRLARTKGVQVVGVYPTIANDEELKNLDTSSFETVSHGFLMADSRPKIAEQSLSVQNGQSLQALADLGYTRAVLCAELNLHQISDMPRVLPTEAIVYGRLTLMITEHCPYNCHRQNCRISQKCGFIKDRKGISFPIIKLNEQCRVAILNSVPIYMADKLSQVKADVLRMVFTLETPQECTAIAQQYHHPKTAVLPQNFTRGHFMRGV
ncbi:MAG: DUF3656 domain-containing protein [Christensenellaceae bacterium]